MFFGRRPFGCCQPFMQQPCCPCECGEGCGGGCGCNEPIVEPTIEKCIKRDFCHEVRHVCPIHTRVINNHIFRHVYNPQYTQSEENVSTTIDQGSCCNFI